MTQPDDFLQALKQAKRHRSAGNLRRSRFFLTRAREWAETPTPGPHRYKVGILFHQNALVCASLGENQQARELFAEASRRIKSDAPLERTIMLRDFGNFELRLGNVQLAVRKINDALRLLENAEPTERYVLEECVTRGFFARTQLEIDPEGSIHTLRELATVLHGCKKPEYELDNLDWLIDHLPFGYQRQLYVVRAVSLCVRLGDHKRAVEFTSLLGGKPLRKICRFVI